jgi:predicted DNA-binding transcriptional regulator YafY
MMTTKRRDGSLSKTARLMFLLKMQEEGTLSTTTKNSLAKLLGVTRFTIYRDLNDLSQLKPMYDELIKKGKQS